MTTRKRILFALITTIITIAAVASTKVGPIASHTWPWFFAAMFGSIALYLWTNLLIDVLNNDGHILDG